MTEIRDKSGKLLVKLTKEDFPLDITMVAERYEKFYVVNYYDNNEKEFLKMNRNNYPKKWEELPNDS